MFLLEILMLVLLFTQIDSFTIEYPRSTRSTRKPPSSNGKLKVGNFDNVFCFIAPCRILIIFTASYNRIKDMQSMGQDVDNLWLLGNWKIEWEKAEVRNVVIVIF